MTDSENELGPEMWRDTFVLDIPVGARIQSWVSGEAREAIVSRVEVYGNEVRTYLEGISEPIYSSKLRRLPVWRRLTPDELAEARTRDRKRQIRIAISALEDWKWALTHMHDHPETIQKAQEIAERRIEPLLTESPYLEYGTQWTLSEEAHGPGKMVVYPEKDRREAEKTITDDRLAVGARENRGVLMYRRAAGPWKEMPRNG